MAKYYYNGVLLPEIPSDVLAEYPYAWIRMNTAANAYDLYFSTEPFYLVAQETISGNGIVKPWYKTGYVGYDESASEWVYYKTSNSNLGFDSTLIILWSNHDIPNGSADATEIYFYGSEPVPEGGSEPEYKEKYVVTTERLIEFADTARKIVGSTATMTPSEMSTAFGNVQTLIDTANAKTGGGDTDLTSAVGTLVDGYGSGGASRLPFCEVEVTAETYYTHFLYNGVRLPRIPDDVLKNYPYAWIRKDTTNGNYDLVFAAYPWYFNAGMCCSGGDSVTEPWYSVPIATAETATAWTFNKNTTGYFSLNADRTVLWSNHDIPNGSADATEIYFEGSEPVPTE